MSPPPFSRERRYPAYRGKGYCARYDPLYSERPPKRALNSQQKPTDPGRPAGLCRRGLLRRDGDHLQARLRGGLHLQPGCREPGVVRLFVLRARRPYRPCARQAAQRAARAHGTQAHGPWRPHLPHLDPLLLRHERTARPGGAHAALPVHVDGSCLADHHDAPRAAPNRNCVGGGSSLREQSLRAACTRPVSPATTPSPCCARSAPPSHAPSLSRSPARSKHRAATSSAGRSSAQVR